MKTPSDKLQRYITIPALVITIVSIYGCSEKICCTKNIFEGNRAYYDFNKKELFRDALHKDALKRPLIMAENKEIQIEITKFNPLDYDIIVQDTAYDRFVSNIEDFDKFIVRPAASKGEINGISSEDKSNAMLRTEACTTIVAIRNSMVKYSDCLNKKILAYKAYLTSIENINSYSDFLKSKETLNKSEIEQGIKSNIIDRINPALSNCRELKESFSEVFKSDFVAEELCFYKQINDLKIKIVSLKDQADILKTPANCDDFETQKAYFYLDYQRVIRTIEDFESTRTDKILPDFYKTMLVYEKLQSLAQNEPLLVTKSYPVNKDVQTVSIFKYDPTSKTKQLYDAINIQLTCGVRIDVSGGLFVSRLYDGNYSLYTDSSSLSVDGGDTIKKEVTSIHCNHSTKVSFGGMIYLQAHTQNASNFNYGGYIGLGALFNDPIRWSTSGGISLIFGRSQRFFLNFGPIISEVDRLSEPFVVDKPYQRDFDIIPITRVWQCSWMVGASWKFGK